MATTYSIIPGSILVNDGPTGQNTNVTFSVSRSGDISQAETVNWNIIDDPTVDPGLEKNFFVISAGTQTVNGEPTGQVKFNAGASQAQTPITITLKGGIDTLSTAFDWATFDLGVKLNVSTASTSGFSSSASGGYGVTVKDYVINGSGGTLSLDYQMYQIPDQADVYLNGSQILTTGAPVSDGGTLQYGGAGQSLKAGDNIQVVITGNIQGTAWDYTLAYAPGISSVVEAHSTIDTGVPGVAELARLAGDAYNGSPTQNMHGYKPFLVSGAGGANIDSGYAGFQGFAYQNANSSEVVIAFRGTNLAGDKSLIKNLLADATWINGTPSADIERTIKDAVAFVDQVKALVPNNAKITLTGHSLGGAVAQAVAAAGHYTGVGFDAPGAGGILFNKLTSDGVFSGLAFGAGTAESNYRLYGDQVSLVGTPVGSQFTVSNPSGLVTSVLRPDIDHKIEILQKQLEIGPNVISGGVSGPNYVAALKAAVALTTLGPGLQLLSTAVTAGAALLVDPANGHNFVLAESVSSPDLSSITLPFELGVAQYRLETLSAGNVWANAGFAAPGVTVSFGTGVRGLELVPLDASGAPTSIPNAFYFQSSFAKSGQVTATFLSQNGGETNTSDFNGDTTSDVLWINPSSLHADEWQIGNGKWAASVDLGTHPGAGAWSSAGIGDFNGDGIRDVLWYNQSTGQMDIWELWQGKWAASVSPGNHPGTAKIVGVADFNGDGTSDILWQDGSGSVDEWQIVNGAWSKSVPFGPHPGGYQIKAVADFTGDGVADVLWFDPIANATDIWVLKNGAWAASTGPGSHPAGSDLVAVGDFNADGTRDILWQDKTTGVLDVWLISGGHWAGSVAVGAHPGAGWQVAGTGDYNADGTSDIFWHNAGSGQTDIWEMKNGHWLASVSPGNHPIGDFVLS